MEKSWQTFFDDIVDEAGILVKNEVKDLLRMSKEDSDEFIQRQGEKVENYLNQLARGEITKQQLEGYLLDIKDLTEMQALKLSVAARARAQRLAEGITDLIVKRLLAII